MAKTFKLKLVTPEKTELNNVESTFLKLRTKEGDVGIYPNHIDFVTILGEGKMEVKLENGDIKSYYINGGFLEVNDSNVIILAEDAFDFEKKDEILEERKRKIEESILEKLKEDKNVVGTKKKIQDSLKMN